MQEDIRDGRHYREGIEAFKMGYDEDDCPYPVGSRTAWLTGWYDGRTESNVGHILDKYGESWP